MGLAKKEAFDACGWQVGPSLEALIRARRVEDAEYRHCFAANALPIPSLGV